MIGYLNQTTQFTRQLRTESREAKFFRQAKPAGRVPQFDQSIVFFSFRRRIFRQISAATDPVVVHGHCSSWCLTSFPLNSVSSLRIFSLLSEAQHADSPDDFVHSSDSAARPGSQDSSRCPNSTRPHTGLMSPAQPSLYFFQSTCTHLPARYLVRYQFRFRTTFT